MNRIRAKLNDDIKVIQITFQDSIRTIFKDRGALLILLFAAIFYPIVYSIAYSNQVVREIPTAVVDLDQSTTSRQWLKMIDATPDLSIRYQTGSMAEAEELFWNNEVKAIVLLPEGFEKNLLTGRQSTASLYADAANFLLYKNTLQSAMAASGTFAAGVEFKRLLAEVDRPELAMQSIQPVQSRVYNLFNPAGSYGSFVMPGLMLLILQQTMLIGIGLVGGAGRERKRSAMESFGIRFVDHPFAAIMGKSLAYFLIGLFNLLFVTVLVYHWFHFPVKGEFLNVLLLGIPFLLSTTFLGMTISLLFKHREHSIMALVFLSPIVLFLSGLSWPAEAIPHLLQQVFKIFPTGFAIPAYLRIRLMGVSLKEVQPEMIALLIQMLVYFLLAGFSFKAALIRKHKRTDSPFS